VALLHVLRHPTVVPSEWWRSAVPTVGIVCGGARTNDQGRKQGRVLYGSLDYWQATAVEGVGIVGLQNCETAGLGQRWSRVSVVQARGGQGV
jgi:hypothetical protein